MNILLNRVKQAKVLFSLSRVRTAREKGGEPEASLFSLHPHLESLVDLHFTGLHLH